MPYVQVQPEDLVIGQEYVLTLKGIESRQEGAEYENVPVLTYNGKPTGSTRKQMKRPATVVAPPTAEGALLTAYSALRLWNKKDRGGPYTAAFGRNRKPDPIDIRILRKKASFAGVKANGLLAFTQERPFGSKKAPPAFIPVANVNKKSPGAYEYQGIYYGESYPGVSPADYAFWKMQGNNTRRNNKSNLVTGNLLGLNNVPQAKENTRTAAQALNNAYQQHEMEQLFKGGRNTRRSRK